MNELKLIEFLDTFLGSMLIMHIINSVVMSRRSHRMLKEHCGCSMTTLNILCNRVFGTEQMSWVKMTTTTILIGAFLMLTIYGSFFGLIGFVVAGVVGITKIWYSIQSRLHSAKA